MYGSTGQGLLHNTIDDCWERWPVLAAMSGKVICGSEQNTTYTNIKDKTYTATTHSGKQSQDNNTPTKPTAATATQESGRPSELH